MISLWITIGLVISATSIATLGAYFSIVGIGALFSGALLAVSIMAGSLEFAKFTLAAYLHQVWYRLNKVYRTYLVFSVVVLSIITSMGIFGFLSDAYQSASSVFDTENVKLANMRIQQKLITDEIARINSSIEEIPVTRLTRKITLRAEMEPRIKDLNRRLAEGEKFIAETNLRILDAKKKVGPLIYIAKMLNKDIDTVVKYLILVFVLVFDPLAICLVIASTHAIESRRQGKFLTAEDKSQFAQNTQTSQNAKASFNNQYSQNVENSVVKPVSNSLERPLSTPEQFSQDITEQATESAESNESDDVIVQMNFKDENEDKKAV